MSPGKPAVAVSQERQPRAFTGGLVAGLLPNLCIFVAIYSTPWADNHVDDWLAVALLYGGPAVVALVGLAVMRSRTTRRWGAGMLLAAVLTIGLWYALIALDTAIAIDANNPG